MSSRTWLSNLIKWEEYLLMELLRCLLLVKTVCKYIFELELELELELEFEFEFEFEFQFQFQFSSSK